MVHTCIIIKNITSSYLAVFFLFSLWGYISYFCLHSLQSHSFVSVSVPVLVSIFVNLCQWFHFCSCINMFCLLFCGFATPFPGKWNDGCFNEWPNHFIVYTLPATAFRLNTLLVFNFIWTHTSSRPVSLLPLRGHPPFWPRQMGRRRPYVIECF